MNALYVFLILIFPVNHILKHQCPSETEKNFFTSFWSKNSTPSSSLITSCHFVSTGYTFTPGHLRLASVLGDVE